jgi:anti-sigma B factor antagonist
VNPTFRAQLEGDDDVVTLVVFGELDQATVPELHSVLGPVVDDGGASLLVDLSDCEFIDSSGLAAFVAVRERVTATEGRGFAVCCPDSQVRRLLELTGLDRAMGLAESRDEALAALRDGVSPDPA